MMPDLDALQFLRLFRQSDPVTPFIIFTGKGREEVAIQAFEGGADHYLQKGENPEEQFSLLREKIIQAYTKRVFEEEIRRQDRLLTAIAEFMGFASGEKDKPRYSEGPWYYRSGD